MSPMSSEPHRGILTDNAKTIAVLAESIKAMQLEDRLMFAIGQAARAVAELEAKEPETAPELRAGYALQLSTAVAEWSDQPNKPRAAHLAYVGLADSEKRLAQRAAAMIIAWPWPKRWASMGAVYLDQIARGQQEDVHGAPEAKAFLFVMHLIDLMDHVDRGECALDPIGQA
jgi:hypothetical protein